MDIDDLRNLLKRTDDKLGIFLNNNIMDQYDLSETESINLIRDFLNDTEKVKLIEHFLNVEYIEDIIEVFFLISDENLKMQIIHNDILMSNCPSNRKIQMISSLSSDSIIAIFQDTDFCKKYNIEKSFFNDIFGALSSENKFKILSNSNFIFNTLNLTTQEIISIGQTIDSVDLKDKLIDIYNFPIDLSTKNLVSPVRIIDLLFKNDTLSLKEIYTLLSCLDGNSLHDFLIKYPDFCKNSNIQVFKIISKLGDENQKVFISKLKDLNFPSRDVKEIILSLSPIVKQSINISIVPDEYKPFFVHKSTDINNHIKISLDYDIDPEFYRGLEDWILTPNPTSFTDEQREKFLKICDVCPNLLVEDNNGWISTGQEYKKAEVFISSFINSIDPNYSKAQKLALADNLIGNTFSYSPDFNTEIYNEMDNKPLWKIYSTGYGICSGICLFAQYLLMRLGIESEIIYGEKHAFLKLKNIELPLADGSIVKGDTILDPTWNLAAHRFKSKPENFCISYSEARKNDIDDNGEDCKCHKNDKKLNDVTLSLDDKSLRALFSSVGLADKEGIFPVISSYMKSQRIAEASKNYPDLNISLHFAWLKEFCPEFATCQNSTMKFIPSFFANNSSLHYKNFVINRVYDRSDPQKSPVLYVYIELDELGKKFYFADKKQGEMIELSQEKFEEKFECYEYDLKEYNGIRPWEKSSKQNIKNSSQSNPITNGGMEK